MMIHRSTPCVQMSPNYGYFLHVRNSVRAPHGPVTEPGILGQKKVITSTSGAF